MNVTYTDEFGTQHTLDVIDPVVQAVIVKFIQRSNRGLQKYGTTLADNATDDMVLHLQEELMDATLYVEAERRRKKIEYDRSI